MPLADDIGAVFTAMKDMTAGGDAYMAQGMATAIANWLATCTVTTSTTPPTTVPMAPASGFASLGQAFILTGAQAQSDAALAAGIANGVGAVAVAGASAVAGVFAGVPSTIQTALTTIFTAMGAMSEGGDDAFAQALATAVISYATSGGAVPTSS